MQSIRFIQGPLEGSVFDFTNTLTIGRNTSCDVALDDAACSRMHVLVERAEGTRCIVRDLASRNGVLVNGQKTQEVHLTAGDVVTLGNSAFVFVGEAGGEKDSDEESFEVISDPSVHTGDVTEDVEDFLLQRGPLQDDLTN